MPKKKGIVRERKQKMDRRLGNIMNQIRSGRPRKKKATKKKR